MSGSDYVLVLAGAIVPMIAFHKEAIEVVYILGRMSAAMISSPW